MKNLPRNAVISLVATFLYFVSGACASAQITIMPLGDSITRGYDVYTDTNGGYRDPLYQDLVGSGISFTFVGVNNAQPTIALSNAGDTYHNGYSGYEVNEIQGNLGGVLSPVSGDPNLGGYWLTGGGGTGRSAVTPSIILLLIGANDINRQYDPTTSSPTQAQFLSDLDNRLYSLVTNIHSLTPASIILVAGITPINTGTIQNAETPLYNSYIKNTLVPSLSYTRYVDIYSSFLNTDGSINTSLIGTDGLHPNRYGYPVMALDWAAAIRSLEGSNPTFYNLTVTDGAGGGSYPAGSVVTLSASAASTGNQFASWSPPTPALCNPYSSLSTYTMPAVSSAVGATYSGTGSVAIPNGTYEVLSSFWDGLAIGASGTTSGSLVEQQTYTAAASQQWTLSNLGNNVVELSLPGTNNALEVPGASTTAGTGLDVAAYTGATNQQWTITPMVGTTEIVNVASGMAVNIFSYYTQSGQQLVQEPSPYSPNQAWAFYPTNSGVIPTQPANLTATAGNAQVGLSWATSSGAISYNIYRGNIAGGESSTPIATGILITTCTDTAVTNGVTYYYKVASVNTTGTSIYSNEASATPAFSLPAPPTDLAAIAGYEKVGLTWNASSGAITYNIYRGTTSGGESPTAIATGLTTTSYTNLGLTDGTTYYYTVAAVNTSGPSAASNEASATPAIGATGGLAPVISVQFQSNSIASGGLTAGVVPETVWNSDQTSVSYGTVETTGINNLKDSNGTVNTGLDETKQDYGTYGPNAPTTGFANAGDNALFSHGPLVYSGSTGFVLNLTGLSSSNTYDLIVYTYSVQGTYGAAQVTANTSGGATYYYTTGYASQSSYIRATSTSSSSYPVANYVEWTGLTASGGTLSAALNAPNAMTVCGFQLVVHSGTGGVPATPTDLVANPGAILGQIALGWDASTGAQTYLIQRATSSGGPYSSIATVASPAVTYTDTNSTLLANQYYFYEIAAANATGTSAYSAYATSTPLVPASYAGWVYSYFGPNAPSTIAGESANPASDGLNNLAKYALGLNPLVSDTFQPTVALSGSRWTFTYQRPANRYDITYTPQASPNLSSGSWTASGVNVSETNSGDPQTWQATYTTGTASKYFFRLQITGP